MVNFDRDAGHEDVRVFDGGDEEELEGSRLPLLIVIALLVLAAFGAVVYLAYQRGVAQGHSEVPRIIAAEPGPAKVAPSNPGGTPTPYTGLKIYQQPAPSDDEGGNDSAAPVPSQTKPAAIIPTRPEAVAPPPKAVVADIAPPVVATPVPEKPAPAHSAKQPLPKPAAIVATTPTPTEAVATAASATGALLQVGSYKSQDEANAAWATFKARHASILSANSADIAKVDLGAKGTWYRLRVAGFSSKAEASTTCARLKADGGDCILAH